jgi:homoserine O-acetyltransferase
VNRFDGNSQVVNRLWNNLIGDNKTKSLKYTILAFNVPGNGFDKTYIEVFGF